MYQQALHNHETQTFCTVALNICHFLFQITQIHLKLHIFGPHMTSQADLWLKFSEAGFVVHAAHLPLGPSGERGQGKGRIWCRQKHLAVSHHESTARWAWRMGTWLWCRPPVWRSHTQTKQIKHFIFHSLICHLQVISPVPLQQICLINVWTLKCVSWIMTSTDHRLSLKSIAVYQFLFCGKQWPHLAL